MSKEGHKIFLESCKPTQTAPRPRLAANRGRGGEEKGRGDGASTASSFREQHPAAGTDIDDIWFSREFLERVLKSTSDQDITFSNHTGLQLTTSPSMAEIATPPLHEEGGESEVYSQLASSHGTSSALPSKKEGKKKKKGKSRQDESDEPPQVELLQTSPTPIYRPVVSWRPVAATDKPPQARWGHTACVSGSKLFVYGGTGNKVYADCYVFDLERNTWEQIETQGQVPLARFGHSCCPSPVSTKEFILFGGHGLGNKHYNELHFFNTETLTWKKTSPDKSFPEARAGHTMTTLPSGKCVVFGGHSKGNKFFNSVHIFNYADMTWKKIERQSGDIPTPRGGHSAVHYNDELVVFGGFDGKKHYNDIYIFNLETATWRKVAVNGTPPTARSGHTATLLDDNKHVIIVGGCQNTVFLNDVHILQLETMTWTQPTVIGQGLRPRFRHTVTLAARNQLIAFGGSSSGVLYNDLYALDVTLYFTPEPPPRENTTPKLSKRSSPKRLEPISVELPPNIKQKAKFSSDSLKYLADPDTINEGAKHMSSPAQFNTLIKDFAESVAKPQPPVTSTATLPQQAEPPQGVQLMQMFLAASMAYKEEHRIREQLENSLVEMRKMCNGDKKKMDKLAEDYAEAEAQLICLKDDLTKLKTAKATAEKELKAERKKRKKIEEEKAKLDEELRRLRGAASREREKQKEVSSVEIEELNKQLALAQAKIVSKNEKLKAMKKDLALLVHREKERLNQEENEQNWYSTPNFDSLRMEELLRLEEHYLSSLRMVGAAKQKQLLLQVEELQRAKAMLEEQKICSICVDREIRVVLIPCGHRCLCRECSEVLSKCPICRKPVSDRIATY